MVYSKIKVTLKDLLLYLLIVTCYHTYLSLYKGKGYSMPGPRSRHYR